MGSPCRRPTRHPFPGSHNLGASVRSRTESAHTHYPDRQMTTSGRVPSGADLCLALAARTGQRRLERPARGPPGWARRLDVLGRCLRPGLQGAHLKDHLGSRKQPRPGMRLSPGLGSPHERLGLALLRLGEIRGRAARSLPGAGPRAALRAPGECTAAASQGPRPPSPRSFGSQSSAVN